MHRRKQIPSFLRQRGYIAPGALSRPPLPVDPNPMESVVFTLNSSTGNQDITGDFAGKTPIAAMFFVSGGTVDGTVADTVGLFSRGCYDGINQWVVSINDRDGQAGTESYQRGATDECIMILDNTGAVAVEANGVSLIADGVRINIAVTNGTQYIGFVVLFFDDSGSADIGTIAPTGASQTITTSIPQDLVILTAYVDTGGSFADGIGANAHLGVGFSIGGTQKNVFWHSRDGQGTSNIKEEVSSNDAISCRKLNGDGDGDATVDNFTATSFDFDDSLGAAVLNSQVQVGYMALNMPNASISLGTLDTPTSTGDTDFTGPGASRSCALFLGTLKETLDSYGGAANDSEAFSVMFGSAKGVASAMFAAEEGVGTTDTESLTDSSQIVVQSADAGEKVAANTFASHASGFTLGFTDVNAAAKKWVYLAMA